MALHPEWVMDPEKLPVWQSRDGARRISPLVAGDTCSARGLYTAMFWVAPGRRTLPDVHPDAEEIYYVVSGQARLVMGEETFEVSRGMTVYVPEGVTHQSFNTGNEDLCYFCVFSPPPAGPRIHEAQNWLRIR